MALPAHAGNLPALQLVHSSPVVAWVVQLTVLVGWNLPAVPFVQ